jgi:hypothetical protein
VQFRKILLLLAGTSEDFVLLRVKSFSWAILLIFIESAKITDRVLKAAFFSAVGSDNPLAG